MTASKLKTGDLVRLKSGGPNLVVTEIKHYYNICVAWINDVGDYQHAAFPEDCLLLIEEKDNHDG
jgi:uncharacterized protein YodC (DUF2158 family)